MNKKGNYVKMEILRKISHLSRTFFQDKNLLHSLMIFCTLNNDRVPLMIWLSSLIKILVMNYWQFLKFQRTVFSAC